MRFVCSKENINEGINIVQKAVSSKTTLPILEGILIEAGERLKLTANDLELGIECYVEADIQGTGAIVLNSRIFGEIIRKMPDSEIQFDMRENNLVKIECENSYFEIKGIAAEGFPLIPEVRKENKLEISQKTIKDMIRQTIFAVSVDETRPILTGSLMECKTDQLTIVSIDGFRMAMRRFAIKDETQQFNVVIPGRTLNEIAKILQPVDDKVTIYNSQNQIIFDTGKFRVISRLLEGKYMNYSNLITKDTETDIIISKKDLLASMERAALMAADEKKYPVKLNIGYEKLIISSSTEIGNVREELNIEMNGRELEIGFNPRYIIDALKAIDEEKVKILFTTNVGPCTIVNPVEDVFAYMIGAVRI